MVSASAIPAVIVSILLLSPGKAKEPVPGLFPQEHARAAVPEIEGGIRIDAKDGDWKRFLTLRIDQRSQLVPGLPTDWKGPEDASCLVRLAHDRSHLYLWVRIRDQKPTLPRPGQTWESGDVFEVFLDCDLEDAGRETRFDGDDLQLLFLPFGGEPRWASVETRIQDELGRRKSLIVDRGYTGIRTARRRVPGGAVLEIAIPFHVLPGFREGCREIGFNLAYGDRDSGRPVYQYLVWTSGRPPYDNTSNFGRLAFLGRPPLVAVPGEAPSWWRSFLRSVPWLLPGLLVFLLLGWARRTFEWIPSERKRLRAALGFSACAVLALAFLLPGLLGWARDRAVFRELRAKEALAGRLLEGLEESGWAGLRGAGRDGLLLDLLKGRNVQWPLPHRILDLAAGDPGRFGVPTLSWEGGASVPYGIPLHGRPLGVPLPESGTGDLLFLFTGPAEPDKSEFPKAVLRWGGGPRTTELFLEERPALPVEDGRSFYAAALPLEGGYELIELEAGGGGGWTLEALALRREGRVPEPLPLGAVSKVGVPTLLRGPFPTRLGVFLPSNRKWRCPLPDPAVGVDRVWLFLEAVDEPGFLETIEGATVGRLRLETAEGPPLPPFDLRHQVQVFAGRKEANPEARKLENGSGAAQIAYSWKGLEGEERITLAVPLDLPRLATLRGLSLENLGPYPLRLRTICLSIPEGEQPFPGASGMLEPAGATGRFRLTSRWAAEFRGLGIQILRGAEGRVEASAIAGETAAPPLLAEASRARAVGGPVEAKDLFVPSRSSHDLFFPLPGQGWEGGVLGLSKPDPERRLALRDHHRLALILGGLAFPWVFVFLLGRPVPRASLRFQLSGALVLVTLPPLAFLIWFLNGLVQEDQVREDRNRVRIAHQKLRRSLKDRETMILQDARALVRRLAKRIAPAGKVGLKSGDLEAILALEKPRHWPRASFLFLDTPDPKDPARRIRRYGTGTNRWLGQIALAEGAGWYRSWGRILLAARVGSGRDPNGLRFGWGRALDSKLLAEASSDGLSLCCDLGGYVLEAGTNGGGGISPALLAWLRSPEVRRSLAGLTGRLGKNPEGISLTLRRGRDSWILRASLLHEPGGGPLALLCSLIPGREASLPLFFGRLPARPFFLGIGGILLAMILFFSWMASDRISRPIERLRDLAKKLSRGDLEVEVAPLHGSDEVASLNEAFADMARELRARIHQLDRLQQASSRLATAGSYENAVLEAGRICAEAAPGAKAWLLIRDRESGKNLLVSGGEGPRVLPSRHPWVQGLSRAAGPFLALRLPPVEEESGEEAAASPPVPGIPKERFLGIPLHLDGRPWGGVWIRQDGGTLDFPEITHLQALLRQCGMALERSRLHRLAIEDPATGLFVRAYFRRRVEQELERCARQQARTGLCRIRLLEADALRRRAGDEAFDRLLGVLGMDLRSILPERALAGRVGLGVFEVLLPEPGEEEIVRLGRRVEESLTAKLRSFPGGEGVRLRLGTAVFPDDGGSASFLYDRLDSTSLDTTVEAPVEVPLERGRALFISPRMKKLHEVLARVADTDLTILFEGETGTGKEVLVDVCHVLSRRREGPLVKVNCAALPTPLLESQLFGHERGAFTGAERQGKGLFELAHGGTLFLDEIGETSPDLQAKLLRVLQTREFRRLGGEKPIRVDLRLLAATHRNLEALTAEGRFREDLFYRIREVRLVIPPLRERKEEIPRFIEAFREERGPEVPPFSPAALDLCHKHDWPGNLRELKNVVNRALVLAPGPMVEAEDLDLEVQRIPSRRNMVPDGTPIGERQGRGGAGSPSSSGPEGFRPPSDEGPHWVDGDSRDPPPEESEAFRKDPVVLPYPPKAGEGGGSPARRERWRLLATVLAERGEAGIAPGEYARLLGISRRTASRDLGAWLRAGLLSSRGARRSLRYRLVALKGDMAPETSPKRAGDGA